MIKNAKLARLSKSLKDSPEARADLQKISTDIMTLAVAGLSSKNEHPIVKLLSYGTSIMSVATACRRFATFYQQHTAPDTFIIQIDEDDRIYDLVEAWFKETLPEQDQRVIDAYSLYDGETVEVEYSIDGSYKQSIDIAGHTVQIYTELPEPPNPYSSSEQEEGKPYKTTASLNIVCPTLKARKDVLKKIRDESQILVKSSPNLYVVNKYGDFRSKGKLSNRSSKSVILKEGQFDRILGYLNDFKSNEKAYNKLDIPFRTGIMLHGAPGSGKSSTALAVANELRMDVFVINVASMSSDDTLSIAFNNIPKRSIIVLEDIDTVKATKDRKKGGGDSDSGVTMQGLLNVLDGFQSPYGVITIMTTNHLDHMDEALLRPGRVDLTEELSAMDTYQLHGLCEYALGFVPEGLPEISVSDGISSASVMGVIRKFVPDFHEAADDVVEFITKKVSESLDKELALT
jgi:hypothetical protein